MRWDRLIACVVSGAALLSACTTLEVRPVNLASGPTPSWTYYQLPFTQFEITVTWRVKTCNATNIEVETTAAATSSVQDDPSQIYEINRDSLRQLFNTAKLTTSFQQDEHQQRINNRLLSVNATIEDQTLPAVTQLISGIGKLATVQAGAAGHVEATGNRHNDTACNDEVWAAVRDAPAQLATVKRLTDRIEALTHDITELQAARTAHGAGDDHSGGALGRKIRDRRQAIDALTAAQTTLDATLKTMTATQTRRWPDSGEIFSTDTPFRLSPDAFHKWTRADEPIPAPQLLQEFDIYARLDRLGPIGREPDAEAHAAHGAHHQPSGGIRYRVPVQGRLLLCRASACTTGQTGEAVLAHLDGPVSQLGYLQTIPVHARFLENVQFSATFSANGAPSSIGYESTGGGTKLGEAVSSALAQEAAIRQAEITRDQTAQQRHLQDLQQQLQILQTEQQIAAANNADVQATSDLNVQIARLRAEIALIEAQNQLRTLTASGP